MLLPIFFNENGDAMTKLRRTVEHVFGTLKHWMGSTHLQTRGLGHVEAEMGLYVLVTTSNASSGFSASQRR